MKDTVASGPITLFLSGDAEKDSILTALQGREVELVALGSGEAFAERYDAVVAKAKQAGGVVVAAGGDGTVNAVAALCCKHKVVLGVIPLGTFNYFARELLIPVDAAEAAQVVLGGRIKTVAAGFVQDRIFLNNASFGLYTKIIRQREKASSYFGRMRVVNVLATVMTLFQRQRPFSIKIVSDRQEEMRKTAMVFIGNNTLQLENLGLNVARCTEKNKLAVVMMKQTTRWQTMRLLLRMVVKHWRNEEKLETFCADSFEVDTGGRDMDVVIDGEIIRCKNPLVFRVEKDALGVIVPGEAL